MAANMGEYHQVDLDFSPMQEARYLGEAQRYARAEVMSRLTSFVVRSQMWPSIMGEVGTDDPEVTEAAMFRTALSGTIERGDRTYAFGGQQPFGAHVDEIPEQLLPLEEGGRFNVHQVISGSVRACMLHTAPGYYNWDGENRVPNGGWNWNITQDLQGRRPTNPYSNDHKVSEVRLQTGDRVVWFERASRKLDGPPNILHLFDRGTPDRTSSISQYHAMPRRRKRAA